jgi:hypothetical protein
MQHEPIRGRWEAPPDELILLAIDRAERHKRVRRDEPGVTVGAIAEHLRMRRNSVASRRLNPILRRLETQGPLARYALPGHSLPLWVLTERGRGEVDKAAASGEFVLPESPQHVAWREARIGAALRISQFKDDLVVVLEQALSDLREERMAPSLEWIETGDAVRDLSRRVGFATYTLVEWEEPTDDKPDIDDPPTSACLGRRDARIWDRDTPEGPRDV